MHLGAARPLHQTGAPSGSKRAHACETASDSQCQEIMVRGPRLFVLQLYCAGLCRVERALRGHTCGALRALRARLPRLRQAHLPHQAAAGVLTAQTTSSTTGPMRAHSRSRIWRSMTRWTTSGACASTASAPSPCNGGCTLPSPRGQAIPYIHPRASVGLGRAARGLRRCSMYRRRGHAAGVWR